MILIPRLFHQIWVGPDPFPEAFARYQQSWLTNHPGWELKFWREDNLPATLRRDEARNTLRVPVERANILRFEVLRLFGGIYIDTDFESLQSVEDIIAGHEFFTADLKPGRVSPAFVGAVAGHPILDRALDDMRPRAQYGHDKAATGSVFFDRLMKHYPDATSFEAGLFYPSNDDERRRAFAVHHRARSWKTDDGLRHSMLAAETRLLRVQRRLTKAESRATRLESELVKARKDAATHEARAARVRDRLTIAEGKIAALRGKVVRLKDAVNVSKSHELGTAARLVTHYIRRKLHRTATPPSTAARDGD